MLRSSQRGKYNHDDSAERKNILDDGAERRDKYARLRTTTDTSP